MDVDRLNHLIFCRLIELEYESSLSSLLCWYISRYNAKFFRGNRSDSISQYLILSDFLKNQDVFASQINKEVMEMIIIYLINVHLFKMNAWHLFCKYKRVLSRINTFQIICEKLAINIRYWLKFSPFSNIKQS